MRSGYGMWLSRSCGVAGWSGTSPIAVTGLRESAGAASGKCSVVAEPVAIDVIETSRLNLRRKWKTRGSRESAARA